MSKEARAKAAASLGEEFVDSEASESDEEADENDDDDECVPKSKRKGWARLMQGARRIRNQSSKIYHGILESTILSSV